MHDFRQIWPNDKAYIQPVIYVYYTLIISVYAILIAFRLAMPRFRRGILRQSFAQQCAFAMLLVSWVYAMLCGVYLFGLNTSFNREACDATSCTCIILYVLIKVINITFLMERLYATHSPSELAHGRWTERFRNPWYIVAAVLQCSWMGAFVAAAVSGSKKYKTDGACAVDLEWHAAAVTISIEFFTMAYLTVGFVVPLYRAKFSKAKYIAKMSCIAAVLGIVSTMANILGFMLLRDKQTAYVCLSSCTADVFVNTVVAYYITIPGSRSKVPVDSESARQTGTASLSKESKRDSLPGTTSFTTPTKSNFYTGIIVDREVVRSIDTPDPRVQTPFDKDEQEREHYSQPTLQLESESMVPIVVSRAPSSPRHVDQLDSPSYSEDSEESPDWDVSKTSDERSVNLYV